MERALLFVDVTMLVGVTYFEVRQLHTKIDLIHVPHTAALKPGLTVDAVLTRPL